MTGESSVLMMSYMGWWGEAERHAVRKGLVHRVVEGVHGQRVAVHGPRTRAVWARRLAHEGLRGVLERVAAVVTDIGEGRATRHGDDVVCVTHGREVVVGVGGLWRQRPGALVARVRVVVDVVGLFGVRIHVVGHVGFVHVVVVKLLEEGAAGAWWRGVGRAVVVLGVHVGGGLDGVGLWGDAVLVVVLEDGGRDGDVDGGLEAGRGVVDVVRRNGGSGRRGAGG